MNDIIARREFIKSQPAVAAAGSALVIGQHCPDGATVERVRALTFRRADVAAEHEEKIRVALENVVDGLTLGAKRGVEPVVDDPVAHDNGPAIGIGLQHTVGPRQNRRVGRHRRVVFKIDHDKIHAAGAEQIVMIVIARAIVAAVVVVGQEVRLSEVLIVKRRRASSAAAGRLIVIAYGDAIRNAGGHESSDWILKTIQGIGRLQPFRIVATVVAVLHAIS